MSDGMSMDEFLKIKQEAINKVIAKERARLSEAFGAQAIERPKGVDPKVYEQWRKHWGATRTSANVAFNLNPNPGEWELQKIAAVHLKAYKAVGALEALRIPGMNVWQAVVEGMQPYVDELIWENKSCGLGDDEF